LYKCPSCSFSLFVSWIQNYDALLERAVGVATPEAVEELKEKGENYDKAKLCIAMKECGADIILEPGFEKLVDCF
jgi:hypothetical protein|tara:strand:- start:210 stop:434 length:225 start_codon:yes stop_codon:yes gene_type:complete